MRSKNRWIGLGGENDQKLTSWLPSSPDLTPCYFFFFFFFVREYVKYSMFVPPLPAELPDLRARIINAFEQINRDMYHRVCDELDYIIDMCRITRVEHMEHL
ncbi:hypothetical protein C0J52_09688 [Blattella germanica]|nr:hypothetical protein C0J52_09688 [Blattella germanica]